MATVVPRRMFGFICHSCRQRAHFRNMRGFSSTTSRAIDGPQASKADGPNASANIDLTQELDRTFTPRTTSSRTDASSPSGNYPFSRILDTPRSLFSDQYMKATDVAAEQSKPHRLFVYAHKHNTLLTLTQPPRSAAEMASSGIGSATNVRANSAEQRKVVDTLMVLSTGNIGFRKGARGSYDAAFQLTAFALKQIQERGLARNMHKLEVILRGFGAGREAVTKALLGSEGRHIRTKISAVMDATRLKHGGPRSKKPRRLG